MKKKEFLTEAKRKAIIADKEKAIIESFAKTFNKIKRIDENRINENENINTLANILQNKGTLDHLENNDRIRLKLIDGEFLKKNPEWKDKSLKFLFWDARSRMVGVELIGTGKSGNAYPKELVIDLEQTNIYEFEEENPLYSRQQEFGINPEKEEDIQKIKNTPPDGTITDMIKQYGYDITYTFTSKDDAVAEVIIYGDNEADDITYYFDVWGDDAFSQVGVDLSEDNKNGIGPNDFKFIENIIEKDERLSDESNRIASDEYLEKLDGDPFYDRHNRFNDDF